MELFLVTGGAGAVLAYLVGIAYARSAFSLLLLASGGLFLLTAFLALAQPDELQHATANVNLLGWLVGTALAARVRVLEWVESLDPQEAA
jgi:hypothetical protein